MLRRRALVLVLPLLCSMAAFGQQGAVTVLDPSEVKRTQVPLDHLYRLFLESQIAIDKSAADLQRHRRMREAVSRFDYRQKALHFSDGQMSAVRQAAHQVHKERDDLWTKAMPTMLQDREWRRLNGPAAGHAPGHDQVDAWQKEYEANLHQTVARLNSRLGPMAAARLQAYIQRGESHSAPTDRPLIRLQPPISGVQR